MTELIGDVVLSCTGGTPPVSGSPVSTATIILTFSTINVTSRLLDAPGNTGASEALLLIDEPGSGQPAAYPGFGPAAPQILCSSISGAGPGGCVQYARNVSVSGATTQVAATSATGALSPGANVFQGTVSANRVTFTGVPILPPSAGYARGIRITNIRANVAGVPGGTTPPFPLTVSVSTSGTLIDSVTNPVLTAAVVQSGLTASVQDATNSGALAGGGASFSQCTGSSNPVPVAMLRFGETFGAAFLPRVVPTPAYTGQSGAPIQNTPGSTYSSESGLVFPSASNGGVVAGLADYGTRLKATFNNIPAGVRIFVSVTNLASNTSSANTTAPPGTGTSPYAALIQGESLTDGNGSPPVTASTTGANGSPPTTGLAELLVVNGAATAVWEVINTNPAAVETFQFGVWQQFSANSPPPGTATVNLGFAPTPTAAFSTSAGSAASSSLPLVRFADTSVPVNLLSIVACQSGCTYTLSGNTAYPVGASSGSVAVAASAGASCAWTASSPANWVAITAGSSGTGNGTVLFNVLANPNNEARSATLTIAGQSFTLTQAGQTKASSTTTLAASPLSTTPGQTVTLTATVSPSTATGTVTFNDGNTALGTVTLSSGTAALATSSLTAGNHSLTAAYSGDGAFNGSTSAAVTVAVTAGKVPTTTGLAALPNPANAGQQVTLNAIVVPITATGTIAFKDGIVTLGTVTLANGGAALTTSILAVGSHTLTASYSGDSSNSASTSAPVAEVINPAANPTTTSLAAAPNPAAPGQPVTLTASVTPVSATGTVTFRDGNATLNTATLTSGAATFSTSILASGTHALTASYSGDTTYGASTSATVTEAINSAANATTTILSAVPNPAKVGQPVTLTATMTPANATGTVTFRDGAATMGTVTLANGSATLSTSTFTVGSHPLTALYNGNSAYSASTSAPVIEIVNPPGATVTLSAFPNPASFGQTVTLTLAVSPASATGTVSVLDSPTGSTLGPATIGNGSATITTSTLRVGPHSLQATYSGDANNASSQSALVTETVTPAATTTTLSVAPASSSPGQTVTLTAAVTPSGATGTVVFKDGAATLGSGTLTNGTATFSTSILTTGSHTLTASYAGDGNYAPSPSNPVTEAVALPATTTTLSVTPASSTLGQTVTLTATVSPSSATGSVTFQDGATILGTGVLNAGTATFTISTLGTGAHSLTASYGGDSKSGASTSSPVTETVVPSAAATTTTTLSVTPVSSALGQAVTLTATVSPSSATGSVTFQDGSLVLGTSVLNAGKAAFTTSTLALGSHSMSAAYGGDSKNRPSSSDVVTASVALATTVTLTVTPASSILGQTVTLTAAVSPSSATGSVTFQDGATILGTAVLNAGIATSTTSTLGAGSHTLSASYGGDSRNAAGLSNPVTETVSKLTSTTALSVSPTSSSPGQAVTLTATVTPSNATGSVAFLDGQTNVGTVNLTGGIAVLTTSTLTVGSHALSASYSGDTRNGASTSPSVAQTVGSLSPVQIASPTVLAPAFVNVAWSQTFRATGGATPYKWTMPAPSPPDLAMTVSGDTAVVSGTPKTAGTYQLTLRVQDNGSQTNSVPFTLTVYPLPSVTISVAQPATPADQPAPQLSLGQPYPFALTGTFTLSFVPNAPGLPAGYSDVQFPGGATFPVTIPANSTTPNPPIPPIQLGSVAGDIIGTLGPLTMAGSTQTVPYPGPSPSVTITVPRLPPIIVPGSVRIANVTPTGFQVLLDASSTPRDLTGGTFVFTAAPGTQMNGCTPNCAVSFGAEAAAWFASAAGVANGGATSLAVPFAFSGDTSVIGTVAVTLTNSVGTSAPVSGGKQ
jgi:hypothetical protein